MLIFEDQVLISLYLLHIDEELEFFCYKKCALNENYIRLSLIVEFLFVRRTYSIKIKFKDTPPSLIILLASLLQRCRQERI